MNLDKINDYITKLTPLLSKVISLYDEQLQSYKFQKNQVVADYNIGVLSFKNKMTLKFRIRLQEDKINSAKDDLLKLIFTLNYKNLYTPINDTLNYSEGAYITL